MANSTRRPINNRKDDKEMAMFDNIRAQYFSSSMASLNVKAWWTVCPKSSVQI